jgi:hypothetical protein
LPQGAAPPAAADPAADEAPASDDAHAPQDEAPAEGTAEEFANGNGHDSSYTYTHDDSYAYSNEASPGERGPFEEAARPPFHELPAHGFDSPPPPPPPAAAFSTSEQGTGFVGSGADAGLADSEFDGSGAGGSLADGGYGSAVVGGDLDTGSDLADEHAAYVADEHAAYPADEHAGYVADEHAAYARGYATSAAPPVAAALDAGGQGPQQAPYAYPPPPVPVPVPAQAPAPVSASAPVKARSAVQARRANLVIARLEPWSVMKFSFLMSLVAWIVLFVAVALLYYALSSIGVFASIQKTLASVTSSQGSAGVNLTKWTSGTRVLGYTMLIGAVDVVLITALSTVGAVVYNLVTHLGGGIEITLKETE